MFLSIVKRYETTLRIQKSVFKNQKLNAQKDQR